MSEETKIDLKVETIEQIQDLIQANLDSADGYEEAGKVAADDYVGSVFTGIGQQRRKHARELQYYVVVNGELAKTEGSWLAGFQRGWMDLRAKVNGGNEAYLVDAMKKAESDIESTYQQALDNSGDSPVANVLRNQLEIVRDGKMRLEQLATRTQG